MNREFQIPRHMRGEISENIGGQGPPKTKCIACGGSGKDFNDLRATVGTPCQDILGTGIYDGP